MCDWLIGHIISIKFIIWFDQIWRNSSKNTLIICGCDPYSPLNYLIRDYFSKLVSLELVLTCLCLYSMTSRIHLVSNLHGTLLRSRLKLRIFFLLHQAIYTLKQSPRAWFVKFSHLLATYGFTLCTTYHIVKGKTTFGDFLCWSHIVDMK